MLACGRVPACVKEPCEDRLLPPGTREPPVTMDYFCTYSCVAEMFDTRGVAYMCMRERACVSSIIKSSQAQEHQQMLMWLQVPSFFVTLSLAGSSQILKTT